VRPNSGKKRSTANGQAKAAGTTFNFDSDRPQAPAHTEPSASRIEPEEPGGEITPFPAGFDHLRSIPVRLQEAKTSGEAPQRETALS
jgi:hypothetical protein